MNKISTEQGNSKISKKTYRSPQLEEFGAVADLTKGSFSTMMDGDGTMTLEQKMMM